MTQHSVDCPTQQPPKSDLQVFRDLTTSLHQCQKWDRIIIEEAQRENPDAVARASRNFDRHTDLALLAFSDLVTRGLLPGIEAVLNAEVAS